MDFFHLEINSFIKVVHKKYPFIAFALMKYMLIQNLVKQFDPEMNLFCKIIQQ